MKKILVLICFIYFPFLFADQTYSKVAIKLHELIDHVESKKIKISDALLAIDECDIDFLIKSSVLDPETIKPIANANRVSSGAATGVLCFDLKNLEKLKAIHGSVIWVTNKISNDDLCYVEKLDGILAFKEDPSSHSMIVTRVHNVPCLTFPQNLTLGGKTVISSSEKLHEGDPLTLDAFNGKLYSGIHPLFVPENKQILDTIMSWTDQYAKIAVHGNADSATEAESAIFYGAKGVDPRTEHMFFHPNKLKLFRKVILNRGESKEILKELLELQKSDFVSLYQTMKNYPSKIRLLDPPLHEFLPTQQESLQELACELNLSMKTIEATVSELEEANPMMGHRGVRLLLTYPQILQMQARAIFEAAIDPSVSQWNIEPYIIIPMVSSESEVILAKQLIDEVRYEVEKDNKCKIQYHLGIMMETPRACLLASQIAPHVDYLSFGSNDLTGLTFGFSRGDVYEKFLKYYFDHNILPNDPFSHLDPAVCQLMKITVEQMREQQHYVTIGLCGEQGSEKAGVFTCHKLGLDTVSCSPSRIPSVRLFAAQAAILDSL